MPSSSTAVRHTPTPLVNQPAETEGLRAAETVRVLDERDASKLEWGSAGADYVCECTGAFTTTPKAADPLANGARKVVITAPPKDDTPMFVVGVNADAYAAADPGLGVVSAASCTTNALAPIVKLLHDEYGIEEVRSQQPPFACLGIRIGIGSALVSGCADPSRVPHEPG